MKIDSALQHITAIQSKGTKAHPLRQRPRAGFEDSISDHVQLTGTSSRLHEFEKQLADLPSEDVDKIASIRQAIAEGSFVVNEEAVAERLVEETMEQLQQRRNA